MGYLRGTISTQRSWPLLFLSFGWFSDAEFGSNPTDRRSTGRYVIYYGKTLVFGKTIAQSTVASSLPASGLLELCATYKYSSFVRGLLTDFQQPIHEIPPLTDTQSSVKTIALPITAKYKHMALPIHFFKHYASLLPIEVHHLNRGDDFANILIKQSPVAVSDSFH